MSTDTLILQFEQKFDFVCTNKVPFVEALQMTSPEYLTIIDGTLTRVNNSKRLELFGGVVLHFVMCKVWFDAADNRGNLKTPSDWGTFQSHVLSNPALGHRGQQLGIGDLIIKSNGQAGVAPSSDMIAKTFKALIGAVFEDGGEAAVLHVVKHLGLDNHPSLMVMSTIVLPTFITA